MLLAQRSKLAQRSPLAQWHIIDPSQVRLKQTPSLFTQPFVHSVLTSYTDRRNGSMYEMTCRTLYLTGIQALP